MTDIEQDIAERKAVLDRLRPLGGDALAGLRHYYDVELTFTSNAIEGNTLTALETAQLIEHGITVGGKPLRDHLEAQDHYSAVQWVRDLAEAAQPITEDVVTELHRRIVARSAPAIAGLYSPHPRRIAGSAVIFPNPLKIPALMETFGRDLSGLPDTPATAFRVHDDLVCIHPFSDGNGRTGRLLMNLVLLRGGYPPLAVRPEDRNDYLRGLEQAQLTADQTLFLALMRRRLKETLDDYIGALGQSITPKDRPRGQGNARGL